MNLLITQLKHTQGNNMYFKSREYRLLRFLNKLQRWINRNLSTELADNLKNGLSDMREHLRVSNHKPNK